MTNNNPNPAEKNRASGPTPAQQPTQSIPSAAQPADQALRRGQETHARHVGHADQPQTLPTTLTNIADAPNNDTSDSTGTGATTAEKNLDTQERPRYVRPKTPHRTMEPVDDLKHDDALSDSLRDSDFVVRSKNPFAGRAYKRSRHEMPQLQRELHYGQYLTMPKGGKPIFSSRERKRKIKSAIAMVAIVAALAIAMLIILHLSGVIA